MILDYDATTKTVMQLGAALIRAIDEHGAPNSFGFGELHTFYRGPSPMLAGKAVRKLWQAFCLNLDAQRPGTRVTLDGGRLHVRHVES